MSSISGLGSSYINTPAFVPSDAGLAIAQGTSTSTRASNTNILFGSLNQSISFSQKLGGVAQAVDSYTSSLQNSHVYDSAYTAPTTQFLKDLAALKQDASTGNMTSAQRDLQAAKHDAPDDVSTGEAKAYAKHDTLGLAALKLENADNTSDYLSTQGYSASAASSESIALAINSVTDHSQNTVASAAVQSSEISDLATSLAGATFPEESTLRDHFLDVITNMVSSTATATTQNQAYLMSNVMLTQMDNLYGRNGVIGSSTSTLSDEVNLNSYV